MTQHTALFAYSIVLAFALDPRCAGTLRDAQVGIVHRELIVRLELDWGAVTDLTATPLHQSSLLAAYRCNGLWVCRED